MCRARSPTHGWRPASIPGGQLQNLLQYRRSGTRSPARPRRRRQSHARRRGPRGPVLALSARRRRRLSITSIVRDADSRLNVREKAAVDAWIASGRPFHVMRDHAASPPHADPWRHVGLPGRIDSRHAARVARFEARPRRSTTTRIPARRDLAARQGSLPGPHVRCPNRSAAIRFRRIRRSKASSARSSTRATKRRTSSPCSCRRAARPEAALADSDGARGTRPPHHGASSHRSSASNRTKAPAIATRSAATRRGFTCFAPEATTSAQFVSSTARASRHLRSLGR